MGRVKEQPQSIISIKSEPLQSHIGASKFYKNDWTMEAFLLPRSSLGLTFADRELQYNSIYLLVGYEGPVEKAYVGQAKKRNGGGSVLLRLREHDKNEEEPYWGIWQYAIVFTSIKDNWGPTELNNLEHLLYQEIPSKNNLNGNNPNLGGLDTDTDYSEKIRQIKAYIKAIGLQIFDYTEETEKIQVESVINDYSTVEDLQNGMARIPEIITPHKLVKAMVDMLPAELFNPDTTFLDLACKGGEYLRELYDRLMKTESLVAKYPDEFERSNHILGKQLFGVALSQLSFERTTKNLKGYSHNIRVIPYYINYIKDRKDEIGQFNDLINKELGQMKFDVIIGNPPYQEKTGGGSSTEVAMPLYNRFIEKALKLNPDYISMIVPSRWMSGGKSVLDDLRRTIVEGKQLNKVYNYDVSTDVFKGVDIAGGVQYFLIDTQHTFDEVEFHNLKVVDNQLQDDVVHRPIGEYKYIDARSKEQYMIITDNKSASIIEKVMQVCKQQGLKRFDSSVLQYRPFGLSSDYEGSVIENAHYTIKVICSNSRETYACLDDITSNQDKIEKYKVCAAKVTCEHAGMSNSAMNVLSKPFIVNPGEVCSMTYLVLSLHDRLQEAMNCMGYIKTKFARFLIRTTLSGMNMTSRNYIFIPYLDFNEVWTDQQLYEKFNLTQEEIDYIESTIKPMA